MRDGRLSSKQIFRIQDLAGSPLRSYTQFHCFDRIRNFTSRLKVLQKVISMSANIWERYYFGIILRYTLTFLVHETKGSLCLVSSQTCIIWDKNLIWLCRNERCKFFLFWHSPHWHYLRCGVLSMQQGHWFKVLGFNFPPYKPPITEWCSCYILLYAFIRC